MFTVKLFYATVFVLGMITAIAYGSDKPPLTDEFFDNVEKTMQKATGHTLKNATIGEAALFVFYIFGSVWYNGNDLDGTAENLKAYLKKKGLCYGESNACKEVDKAVAQQKSAPIKEHV